MWRWRVNYGMGWISRGLRLGAIRAVSFPPSLLIDWTGVFVLFGL